MKSADQQQGVYRYLFGPVPSRRLGVSLGVDLVPPKTCSLNCVYCECGATTHLTVARRAFASLPVLKAELEDYLRRHPAPDYVTFSGAGEPTLDLQLGAIIALIRRSAPACRIAVLTNGTLLTSPDVRRDLAGADVVVPSLDAAREAAFRAVNRPHPSLTAAGLIAGIAALVRECPGEVWLEVFIVPGLNDTVDELAALKAAILTIAPARVQLNTLDRPGAVGGLEPASAEELARIVALWDLPRVEIIAAAREGQAHTGPRRDPVGVILETVARRPCTRADLAEVLGLPPELVGALLAQLEASGRITQRREQRGIFFVAAERR